MSPRQSLFDQERQGIYVLGVDKYGWERFIAIPHKETTERDPKLYSPRLLQWPFAYSFTQIADFATEHGYKFADGIDNLNDKQLSDYYKGAFAALDCKERFVRSFDSIFGNAEKKYDELSVKLVLYYKATDDESAPTHCFIMQEGKELKLYEKKVSEYESTENVFTYKVELDKENQTV